ncbi:MAG TPA: NADH-quinone oxidoreductase subunit L [Kofleriaceae bacterium]|nr:NADH-quinone oxidoreductase subunit L [Kofleriaceae bacterium]
MDSPVSPLWIIPALPLAGAAFNLLAGRHFSRAMVHMVAVLSVAGAFASALYLVAGPLWQQYQAWSAAGRPETMPGLHQLLYTWIEVGNLEIALAFRMDTLAAVMVLIITFVGLLIHVYSTGYMAEEPRYATYFGYLNLFTGAMLILVLGDNLPVMFIGWEGVGLCSYLLIGFWFTEEAFAYAGRKAFIVNRIGDFAFLLGICLLFWSTGTLSFSDYQSAESIAQFKESFVGGERLAMFAGVLLFIGACGKSAQIPLYVWLPDAMAGPTPVSALIHAATMVTAGVYMVARMSFLFAHSTTAMAIVAGIGALTALFAAIMAFAQTDLKRVLAYSTVSQLGFMFVGVGVGAYAAGIFHLLTHAFFKAGLFLAAGSVMHAMSGSGDITRMGGLKKKLPYTHISFAIYCLAIAGIFPFAGFFSKDEILAGTFSADAAGWFGLYGEILWAILSIAALGTAFYMFRLYYLVFAGESRADEETRAHIHESPASMTMPLIILAAFTVVIGFIGLPHLSWVPGWLQNILGQWLDASLVNFGRESLGGTIHEKHFTDNGLYLLMGIALGIGVVGILAARALYRKGPPAVIDRFTMGAGAELYRVVLNKFYVDEIYDRIVLRPFRAVSQLIFEVIDRFLIDWIIVDGSAFVVDVFGRVARWFQNGQVQRYMVGLVVGGALVVFFATRSQADFDWWQTAPLTIELEADVGSGPGSDGAIAEFDFDGDGRADWTGTWKKGEPPLHVTWTFSRPGQHEVTMWLTDSVFDQKGEVTETVTVDETAPAPEPAGQPEPAAQPAEQPAEPPASAEAGSAPRQPIRTGGGEP